ncbi:hypothetical protein SAMN04487771_10906 [[Clostridium] aminophilum]|uniref:Glyoxalase/fosfomycin resistance/dioxygenase domain-containing protein n=1 Tax=[Clostridium] aminophilum TaxID=1526 RepID=A0A1I0ILF2_9FIRM|nr:VOC family protein [[Clostridium] aminophilum]SET97883.1 hypothetical protein SAMN04487771_10906 [[Clostridium] aminophilum]
MKITTFNPQIITKNAEPLMKLFQELGFEKRHDQEGIGELNVEGIRMKNDDGFYLDISIPETLPAAAKEEKLLPHDMVVIRMNVDDFDAAYQVLEKQGFRNVYANGTVDTKSSRSAVMISPTGFGINVIQHIKH